MASTGAAAGAEVAERGRRPSARRGSSVRAVATVLVTAGFCWLATAVLKTGDVPVTARLWATLDQLSYAQHLFAESCGRGSYAASIDQLLVVLDFHEISSDPPFLRDARTDLPGRLAGVEIAGGAGGECDGRARRLPQSPDNHSVQGVRYAETLVLARSVTGDGTDGVIWQSATAARAIRPARKAVREMTAGSSFTFCVKLLPASFSFHFRNIARQNSRFIVAMFRSEMPFGQTASHSPSFEHEPKPSSSIRFDHRTTRVRRST